MDLGLRGRNALQLDGSSSHPEAVLVSPRRPHRILGTGKAWQSLGHFCAFSLSQLSTVLTKYLRRSTHEEERFIWLPSWKVPFHSKRDIGEGF